MPAKIHIVQIMFEIAETGDNKALITEILIMK